jgi:hypothetical protein
VCPNVLRPEGHTEHESGVVVPLVVAW